MSVEENKALIRRFVEAWNNKDEAVAIDELLATTLHSRRQFLRDQAAKYPERHYTIEDMIAEGDKVVVRLSYRSGPHVSNGEQKVRRGVNIYRVGEGKIQELWFVWQAGEAW